MEAPPTAAPTSSRPGCLAYLVFGLASLWVVAVTVLVHGVAWVVDQILIVSSIYSPWFTWPLITWAAAALVAAPALLLARFVRTPRTRTAYRTWAVSAGFVFLVAPARAVNASQLQLASLLFVLLGGIALYALAALTRRRGAAIHWDRSAAWAALSLGPIVAAPMFSLGALGSALDTVLTLLAGLTLGLFAGGALTVFLFRPLADDESRPSVFFAGFSAAVALTILAGGFGATGSQLLLLAVLPALGFSAAAIARAAGADKSALPIALLVGLAAAAPLMFFDPAELALVLGLSSAGETLSWAIRAAGASLVLGLVVSVVALVVGSRPRSVPRGVTIGGAALVWLAAAAVYVLAGRPGLYGDQLFVILKDQADLSPAASIASRDNRAHYVYATLTAHADQTQASLRATLDGLRIGYQPYYLVNALRVDAEPVVGLFLSAQPGVDRVLDNPRLRPLPAPLEVSKGDLAAPKSPPWNIKAIGADRVWSELGIDGKGVVVGQSDSGVDGSHPALAASYRGRTGGDDYNWLDPWNGTRSPTDIDGHGTHTLGTILGSGGIGIAPGAQWIGCVNLARNLGNPGYYLDCMQFMLAPFPQRGDPFRDGDPARGAEVMNNSWGCPPIEGCDPTVFQPAVTALRAAGIFVVVSAGNNGPRCASLIEPLALYGNVLSVGAMDRRGNLSFFSSRGPVTVDGSNRVKPDLIAPGEEVVSSFPGNTYASEEGTSMAGPHVVGTVALMWSANPKLVGDIDRTEKILLDTAKPYAGAPDGCSDGRVPNNATGYGVLDAYAAVKAALAK